MANTDQAQWWRDFYEERAAIREYSANQERFIAEKLAYIECLELYRRKYDCDKNHAIIELTKANVLNPTKVKNGKR